MTRYDLVVFDFDGTLADSFSWFWEKLPTLVAEFRLRPLDPSRKDEYRGLGARSMVAQLGVRWWQMPLIARRVRQLMATDIAAVAPFDGVCTALHRLRDVGIKIAVVTSNSEVNVRRVLGPAASACIDHYDCDAPMFGKKRRTRRAIRSTGTMPRLTLCVGDELRDAEAAHAAGADFAGVTWGYTVPSVLARASDLPLFASPADFVERLVAR